MSFFNKLKNFFGFKNKKEEKKIKKKNVSNNSNYQNIDSFKQKEIVKEVDNENSQLYLEDLWNYIDPIKNTQPYHLLNVIGFDEWVDMNEIRKRIKQMFFIEYKNEKSLYPYIKTLSDVGLLETSSVGGKRKWKKKEIIIKLRPKSLISIKNKEKVKNIN